jgi:hypothetical protein
MGRRIKYQGIVVLEEAWSLEDLRLRLTNSNLKTAIG